MSLQILESYDQKPFLFPSFAKVPPQVEIRPGDQRVNESDTLSVFCNASGNPTPNITWRKLDKSSPAFPSGNILKITSVNKTDAGMYECRANNGIRNNDTASFKVTVNCEYAGRVWFKCVVAVSDTRREHETLVVRCEYIGIDKCNKINFCLADMSSMCTLKGSMGGGDDFMANQSRNKILLKL